jgi:GAF domain-containing protein
VNADPRYLACFPSTRSEIVVPVVSASRPQQVVAEIDIDSDGRAAFDAEDRRFLEHVARMLSTRIP